MVIRFQNEPTVHTYDPDEFFDALQEPPPPEPVAVQEPPPPEPSAVGDASSFQSDATNAGDGGDLAGR
jgi:hypothetical protein